MRNVLITVEYDGSPFHGWQRQPEAVTVQGVLEEALSLVCGEEIHIDGTGRTDAGVHALCQCATFSGEFGIPADRIPYAVNNVLLSEKSAEGAVRVLTAEDVPECFHARFSASGKTYRYRILNSAEISVFDRNLFYHIKYDLDVCRMRKAAEYIKGTHDFACFQAAGGQERLTTVRTVSDIEINEIKEERGKVIDIEVTGDGFLYNMVRIIAGTLVDAGCGKIEPEKLPEIIISCDRTLAGHTAPPQGLYLKEVYFDK